MIGALAVACIYATVFALHLVVPAQRVPGYVKDATGTPLVYRLNALRVLFVTLALATTACRLGAVPWDFLWVHRWGSLAGAIAIGLAFSIAIVVIAPSTGRSFVADLFFGRLENPRMLGGRLDLKMFLYQVGATMLVLNLLSFAAHHAMVHPHPSPGVLVYTALLGWFVLDYLFFERVHLYTYDLFAERVGFKLGFGCLAFYPYFYVVGLWATAELPDPGRSTAWYVLATVVFFAGWSLARGANMQKFFFKIDPSHRFLGLIAPEVVTDGRHTLLVSGFWAVSRHVNYLGEILMATGLALALGWPGEVAPWLYPLYYVLLLVPRERDDHRRCATKYGALWAEYCRRVPRRIVPGIY